MCVCVSVLQESVFFRAILQGMLREKSTLDPFLPATRTRMRHTHGRCCVEKYFGLFEKGLLVFHRILCFLQGRRAGGRVKPTQATFLDERFFATPEAAWFPAVFPSKR